MQILSWLPTALAAALAAATLISTLASLFGRARLQRCCDTYRNEIGAGTQSTKEIVEALHLKWLAQLIARDTYPARWTLFVANLSVLFGILISVIFGQLVATQDDQLQEGATLLAPLFMLFIVPVHSTWLYLNVVLKRTDIRREVAERATGRTSSDEQETTQNRNLEFFLICVGATIPNVISFSVSFMIALDGRAFDGPSWVMWTISAVSVVSVIVGGAATWHHLPRLMDQLEAWAVEPIKDLPTRPNERDDALREMQEDLDLAQRRKQEKTERRRGAGHRPSRLLKSGR